MSVKIGFASLGCPKNLVDTEVMLGILARQGYEITNREDQAEVLIVNTCSFIETAKNESIQQILELAQFKDGGRCRGLIVAGCLAQRYGQELLDEMPEIDAVVGTGEFPQIARVVEQVLKRQRTTLIDVPRFIYDHQTPRQLTTPGHFAYLKIADGCNNHCAYCVIPQVRGEFRSRPMESILGEARRLIVQGVKEIILVAQDTTRYGVDIYGWSRLPELLRVLAAESNLAWVRWLYGYPGRVSDELLQVMSEEPKICNYLDLPLQHAAPGVLARMNRPTGMQQVQDLLHKVRQMMPDAAIRTSFIVGYPGETEDDFKQLLDFVAKNCFDRVGVFPYSAEENTPAAEMADQIDEDTKKRRYAELMSLQQGISLATNQAWIGRTVSVLTEGQTGDRPQRGFGRTERDAPDIDGLVFFKTSRVEVGEMVQVKITGATEYDLMGEVAR